jgi:hypothetical protein
VKLIQTIQFFLFATCCFADEVSSSETPSGTNGVKIIWNVPTNHWPSGLWIYKIVPQNFSPAVISNLMHLGTFTMGNLTNIEGQPPFKDKQLLYFANSDRTRYLGIFPPYGWIYYKDRKAEVAPKKQASGVPSEEETYQLALDYLRLFGIDRSQLATKGDSTQLRTFKEVGHHGWFDKMKGTNVEEVSLRGIFFIRRIDGIDFSGIGPLGGVHISFGNDGKIAGLEIVWKGLEPFELHRTLSSEQMMDAIQRGQSKWKSPIPNPQDIKKITITEVMLFYRGAEGESDEQFIEPFTLLATSVDYGYTNLIANLECSILSTNAVSAIPSSEIKTSASGRTLVPKEGLNVLENADEFTLLSLDPEPGVKATNNFHGYSVFGKVQIKDGSERHASLDALYAGIAMDGPEAMCFNPRHGIRAKMGNQVEDLVICFECGQIYFYGVSEGKLSVNGTPATVLNRILSAAHIPISK